VDDLDERVRLLESFVLTANDAVLITRAEPIDTPGPYIIYVNPAFTRMTGYTPEEALGKSPRFLQGPESCPDTRERIRASLKAWKPIEAELLNYRKDDTTFWVEISISLVTDETGWHTHWISVQRDVTERHQRLADARQHELISLRNAVLKTEIEERQHAEERLTYVAFHDDLTGLRNRAFFIGATRDALVRVQRGQSRGLCAVLYLDLDAFKAINDTLGHRVGDELLVEIGQRLKACARANDVVARIGGDEFTLLIENLPTPQDVQELAERILHITQAQLMLASTVLHITPSIGICHVLADYADAESILRDADLAMYAAKRAGGGRWTVFGRAMHEKACMELQKKLQLRDAVDRGEFVLFYQPIINSRAGSIYGIEALIRWNHPGRGLLSPGEFVALAEQTGLIVPIGRWVMREACSKLHSLQEAYREDLCLSLNVSSRQLEEPDFLLDLVTVLAETGINPSNLQLEITESIFLNDANRIGQIFREIRRLGVRIAFDDFGTGYSSLKYLEQYPIDTLKIDQSFVQNMSENHVRASIVRMILQLADEIGITVTAEGVETREQEQILRHCGCHIVQGYLYGRPMPLDVLVELLQTGSMSAHS
jgi:diguanylate cyclase (GGDEF)-like protein/PAS domain S-box-containing protein